MQEKFRETALIRLVTQKPVAQLKSPLASCLHPSQKGAYAKKRGLDNSTLNPRRGVIPRQKALPDEKGKGWRSMAISRISNSGKDYGEKKNRPRSEGRSYADRLAKSVNGLQKKKKSRSGREKGKGPGKKLHPAWSYWPRKMWQQQAQKKKEGRRSPTKRKLEIWETCKK